MPTTTLTLGAVTLGPPSGGITDPNEEIVGDPPQWSDGSDATYAFIGKTFTIGVPSTAAAHTRAAAVAGNLTAWTVTVRAASVPGFGADPTRVIGFLMRSDIGTFGAFVQSEDIEFPNDGAVHEVTVAGRAEDIADTVDDNPDGWLSADGLGPYVQVSVSTTFSRVHVYEVTVSVSTADETVRVTRQFPRDDAYGLGSAPRLVPAPRGGRIVGGYT